MEKGHPYAGWAPISGGTFFRVSFWDVLGIVLGWTHVGLWARISFPVMATPWPSILLGSYLILSDPYNVTYWLLASAWFLLPWTTLQRTNRLFWTTSTQWGHVDVGSVACVPWGSSPRHDHYAPSQHWKLTMLKTEPFQHTNSTHLLVQRVPDTTSLRFLCLFKLLLMCS